MILILKVRFQNHPCLNFIKEELASTSNLLDELPTTSDVMMSINDNASVKFKTPYCVSNITEGNRLNGFTGNRYQIHTGLSTQSEWDVNGDVAMFPMSSAQ